MGPHRPLGDAQLGSNLPIGQAETNQGCNLALASCQQRGCGTVPHLDLPAPNLAEAEPGHSSDLGNSHDADRCCLG